LPNQVIIPGVKAKVDPNMAQQVRDAEVKKREQLRKRDSAMAAQRAQAQARARADKQMRSSSKEAAGRDAAATLVASHLEVQAKGRGAGGGGVIKAPEVKAPEVKAPQVKAPEGTLGKQRGYGWQAEEALGGSQQPQIKSSALPVKQLIIKCHHQHWLSVEQIKECNRLAHARKEYSLPQPASPPPPAVKAPEINTEADGAARPDTTSIITARQSEEDLLEEANERREILQEKVAPAVEFGQPKPPGQFVQMLQASVNMPALWIAAGGLGVYGVSRYVRRRRFRSGQRRE
jgi:hypothetical protein